MASTIGLRRLTTGSNSVISKLLNRARYSFSVVPFVSRSFTSDTQPTNKTDDREAFDVQQRSSSDRSLATSRRGSPPPAFLSDWIDPFSPTRTLSQVFNLMDQLMDPHFGGVGGGTGTGTARGSRLRGWDVKEDEKTLYLKMDMPGLGKEDVKVWVEGDVLVIKGESKESDGEGEGEGEGRKLYSRIQLPPNLYKLDEIKGEMKNGVLKLLVSKVSGEEKEEIRQVQLE